MATPGPSPPPQSEVEVEIIPAPMSSSPMHTATPTVITAAPQQQQQAHQPQYHHPQTIMAPQVVEKPGSLSQPYAPNPEVEALFKAGNILVSGMRERW